METIVSTTAAAMTAQANQYRAEYASPKNCRVTGESFTRKSTMAIICVTVFALPYQLAAITLPSAAASMRMPDTMNSRQRMMNTGQEGSTPSSMSTSSAAVVRILSASGSTNLPKFVTSCLLRAR